MTEKIIYETIEKIVQDINIQRNELSERNATDKEFIQLEEAMRTSLEPYEAQLGKIIKHYPPKPMILAMDVDGKILIKELNK